MELEIPTQRHDDLVAAAEGVVRPGGGAGSRTSYANQAMTGADLSSGDEDGAGITFPLDDDDGAGSSGSDSDGLEQARRATLLNDGRERNDSVFFADERAEIAPYM